MLSFRIVNSGRGIQMHCDDEGVAVLMNAIERLRRDQDHIHLRTPSNGGRELDEQTPFGLEAIGEVIIDWEGD